MPAVNTQAGTYGRGLDIHLEESLNLYVQFDWLWHRIASF